jgi:predicted ester cyclase
MVLDIHWRTIREQLENNMLSVFANTLAKITLAVFVLSLVLLLGVGWSPAALAAITPSSAELTQAELAQTKLTQANKSLTIRYATAGWGTQPNWEAVWDELVDPNVVLHFNNFPEPIVGLEANKQFSKELFVGFPAIKNTIEDVVAEGDTVIYRSRLIGKNTGPFLGMPATGKVANMNDFTQVRIKNGKIVEWWYETNLLALLQQLGVAPEIPPASIMPPA